MVSGQAGSLGRSWLVYRLALLVAGTAAIFLCLALFVDARRVSSAVHSATSLAAEIQHRLEQDPSLITIMDDPLAGSEERRHSFEFMLKEMPASMPDHRVIIARSDRIGTWLRPSGRAVVVQEGRTVSGLWMSMEELDPLHGG